MSHAALAIYVQHQSMTATWLDWFESNGMQVDPSKISLKENTLLRLNLV